MSQERFNFSMLSNVGRVRQGNEDTCAAAPEHRLFVVCDGMGGAAAGEVASALAAKTFLDTFVSSGSSSGGESSASRLRAAVHAANEAVHRKAQRDRAMRGMGTTLVALLLSGDGTSIELAHVGDSRCYRFRGGGLAQLTADHSFVEEQVRMGEITAAQAAVHPMRNIITRVVGTGPEVEPDILRHDAEPGDLYLLASDGLTRDLEEADLSEMLSAGTAGGVPVDVERLCRTLIDRANQAGGGDNITVLLVQIP